MASPDAYIVSPATRLFPEKLPAPVCQRPPEFFRVVFFKIIHAALSVFAGF
jgi:hypothetical protein